MAFAGAIGGLTYAILVGVLSNTEASTPLLLFSGMAAAAYLPPVLLAGSKGFPTVAGTLFLALLSSFQFLWVLVLAAVLRRLFAFTWGWTWDEPSLLLLITGVVYTLLLAFARVSIRHLGWTVGATVVAVTTSEVVFGDVGLGLGCALLHCGLVATALQWSLSSIHRFELAASCVQCGYDLANNTSGICPECGKPIDPSGVA